MYIPLSFSDFPLRFNIYSVPEPESLEVIKRLDVRAQISLLPFQPYQATSLPTTTTYNSIHKYPRAHRIFPSTPPTTALHSPSQPSLLKGRTPSPPNPPRRQSVNAPLIPLTPQSHTPLSHVRPPDQTIQQQSVSANLSHPPNPKHLPSHHSFLPSKKIRGEIPTREPAHPNPRTPPNLKKGRK